MAKNKIKNIFSYDETTSRMGIAIDGEEFVVRRADSALAAKFDGIGAEAAVAQKAANLPLPLRIAELICAIFGMSLLGGAIDAITDAEVPFSVMVENGFWYFVGFGAGMLAVAALLFFLGYFRRRRVMASPALFDLKERASRLEREARESLLVPETAFTADLYVPVRGRMFGILLTQNVNKTVSVYADRGDLCIATVGNVVRIPLDRIEEIACVRRRIDFRFWNKDVPCGTGPYAKYKIRPADGDRYTVKPYYAVTVRGSEPFEFFIPPYEFENFAPLLGGKAGNVVERKK